MTTTGTATAGMMEIQSNVSVFNAFVIAKSDTAPIVDAGNDTTICQGARITMGGSPTASGGTSPYTFLWSPADGLDTLTAANPFANPQVTTDYILTVTDGENTVVKDTIRVTVNPHPVVDAGFDKMLTPGDTITLGGSPVATGSISPYSYRWSPSSGLSSSTVANPLCFIKSSQSFSLTVTDDHGCKFNDLTYVQLKLPWLGYASTFSLLSGEYIKLTNAITIDGKVGAQDSISATVNSRDSVLIHTSSVIKALDDLETAMDEIGDLVGTRLTTLSGTITPGVYEMRGNVTLNSNVTLQGNSGSLFIFNLSDSLIINNDKHVYLDGVAASQVIWNISGNLHINGTGTLNGIILVGAATLGGTL